MEFLEKLFVEHLHITTCNKQNLAWNLTQLIEIYDWKDQIENFATSLFTWPFSVKNADKSINVQLNEIKWSILKTYQSWIKGFDFTLEVAMILMVFKQESEFFFLRNPIFMMSKICKISGKIQTRHVIRWMVFKGILWWKAEIHINSEN